MTILDRFIPVLIFTAAFAALASCLPRKEDSSSSSADSTRITRAAAAKANTAPADSKQTAAQDPGNPKVRTAAFALG